MDGVRAVVAVEQLPGVLRHAQAKRERGQRPGYGGDQTLPPAVEPHQSVGVPEYGEEGGQCRDRFPSLPLALVVGDKVYELIDIPGEFGGASGPSGN